MWNKKNCQPRWRIERRSMNYNKVILMGRLVRDIELKHIPSGQAVAQIGLAVNRKYKSKDGKDCDETTFIECEAWQRVAEVMQQYLSKGKPVMIDGRLKLDTWQDKDGSNRSKLKVVIENFQFIDSKGDSAAPAAVAGGNNTDVDDSSIPF